MVVQVDLALEGRHLWQFNWNFRDTAGIRFPYPIYPLVAPEVRPRMPPGVLIGPRPDFSNANACVIRI